VVAGLLVVAVLIRLPTLDLPLLERHAFRQTQTAYTARIFHTDGIDLLHPQLPVLGPPWEVPFEFPLFQAGAALLMDAGVDETIALRGFCLAWFIVSAVLLYALVRPRIGRVGAIAALAVFLFSPLDLVWSRTSMIEFLAVAASLGFAVAALRWRDDGGARWWALAAALGSIAMLVKVTSAVFWIVPFALLGFGRDAGARRHWRSIPAWGLVLVPVAAGLAWTRHADAIKAASDATAWLTSGALVTWNFGTLEQRQDLGAWASALRPSLVLTAGGLLPIAAIAAAWVAVRRGQWRFWAWMAVAFAAPVLVFFNLYVVHDYYSAAIAAPAAAIVGAGVSGLAGSRHQVARLALGVAVVAFAVVGAVNLEYVLPIYGRPPISTAVLDLADQVAAETLPDQPVAIIERDWDPSLLYYADRRGSMVRGAAWPPGMLERFLADGWAVYRCPFGADTCVRITSPPG
jgi:4-amino-4-deoxy-L-arabinose transferase-like glycosyltransferase